jgi:hypothetical protein
MGDISASVPRPPPVLRGWLIWFFLALVAGIGLNVFALYMLIFGFEENSSLLSMWRDGSLFQVGIPGITALASDVLLPLAFLAYLSWLLLLFFRRSKQFPWAFFMLAAVSLGLLIPQSLVYQWAGIPLDDFAPRGGGVLGSVIGYQ